MEKHFTSLKVGLYLLILIVLQPIVFNILNLYRSKIISIIGHLIFILIGILLIYLHSIYNKDKSNN
ncbi:protein-S-isoprenylcysteine O-methyltransferase Ste14 [Staphylococcus capitis]